MKLRKLVSVCLMNLMLLGLVGNFLTSISVKPISVSDVVEEITPPTTPYRIAVDSRYGYVYYVDDDGDVWKSIDEGVTWSKTYNRFSSKIGLLLEFDSNDNLFLQVAVNKTIMKSTDYGQTFKKTTNGDVGGTIWHFSEASNGSLYMQLYSTNHPYVYKSNDNGDSWSLYFNMTEHYWQLVDHLHVMAYNPYTDECYIGSGDGIDGDITLWRYTDVMGWQILWNLTQNYQYNYNPTAIWFDETYVYFGSDGSYDFISRMPHKGNLTEDWCGLLKRDEWGSGLDFATHGIFHDNVHIVTTYGGRIFGSFDGEHWVCLYSTGSDVYGLAKRRSQGNYYWACDFIKGKIIRMAVDKQVLAHLFYKPYTTLSDNTVTFETTIRNGTSYVDLSNYGVSNAKVKFQGVQFDNLVTNGSFESGVKIVSGVQYGSDGGGWWSRYGDISQVSGGHEGSYCLMAEVPSYPVVIHALEWHEYPYNWRWRAKRGNVYTFDCWIKGNFSTPAGEWALYLIFGWKNSTNDDLRSIKAVATTEWTHIWWAQIIPSWATHITWYLEAYDKNFKLYFDEITFTCYNDTVYDLGGLGNQAIHSARMPNTWINDTAQTTDLSVTIGTQTFEHSGILSNGEWTAEYNLNLTGGILEVSADMTGSYMVKIHVEGTKTFQITNGILRNRLTAGLFNGTYYGTPSFDTETSNLVILVQKETKITSASLTSDTLTFTISGYSGLSSTTKVYCGDKGSPHSVSGAASWSYDDTSNMVTISITHPSSATVWVEWRIPGDVNGNGIVDIHDLARIGKAYGATPESPNWDEFCDISGPEGVPDDIIDIYDLAICGENYGKTI